MTTDNGCFSPGADLPAGPILECPFGRLARLLLHYSTTVCNAGGLRMGWVWALAVWLAIGLGFGLGWSIAWRTVRRGMRRSP